MTRAVAYLRVSTKEQADEGYSIAAQREACLRFIDDRGWVLADEFCDQGESARTADRPQFRAMLERLTEDHSVQAVVVHKLDRLARNLEDHVTVRARLRKMEVQVFSVSESLEESASGKLVEGILASIAEFYSANLGQEVRKGMGRKASEGIWPTQAAIGYRNVRVSRNARRSEAIIVPDDERAPIIRQAFELYATGEWPLRALHEEMSERGLLNRAGNPIALSRLADLLKDKIYLGKVVWHGVEYDGIHEPLVTQELFDRVQEVFRLHDLAGERKRRHEHYLRGTVFCGSCGSRLCSMISKGRFTYFFCLGAHNRRTDCHSPYVPEAILEQEVEERYQEIRLSERDKTRFAQQLEHEVGSWEKGRVRSEKDVSKKLARLEAERERLVRAYCAGAIEIDLLKQEQERIAAEVAQAEALRLDAERIKLARDVISVAEELIDLAPRAYASLGPAMRRRYNRAFFEAVHVEDRQVVRVKHQEPFEGLLTGGFSKTPLVPPGGIEPEDHAEGSSAA